MPVYYLLDKYLDAYAIMFWGVSHTEPFRLTLGLWYECLAELSHRTI